MANHLDAMGSEPVVSVLVVTWNNEGTLADCLQALRSELPRSGEILTLDNRSVDASVEIAETHGATVVALDSNVGFAAGMNRLAGMARGDFLVLVNPDVFLHQGAIRALLGHFPRPTERRVVGGLLLDRDGDPELTSARPFPTAIDLTRWLVTQRRSRWSVPEVAQQVEAVSGAFFATSRTVWRELGGFDQAYLHSGEDLDLFWRASRIGATVLFEPHARATHVGGASVRQAPIQIDALRLSGALRLVRRREGPAAALLVRIVLLSRSAGALALDGLHIHRLSARRRDRAKAIARLALLGDGGPRLQLPLEPERSA